MRARIMNRKRLPASAILAVGAALGYFAATAAFRLPAAPAGPRARAGRGEDGGVCCSKGLDEGVLLAQAATPTPLAGERRGGEGDPARKPNIVVITGDDVGWFNIGAYHRGLMSGKTPNLDR